ncbi:MAG: protein kinase [Deltaproteobacteria bacterium]|nr:protein kinase [Deltaproteobacteria bacterium]
MPPPPPVPDRTVTLAPRESDASVGARAPAPIAAPPTDDPERYELVGEHARGGLGRVVRAVDKRLGRTVAVKELLRHNESNEARFMREALITARLQHPGIVPVHEAGRWPSGDPYYVMKLVEGRTLKELIAERTPLRDRLSLLPHVIAVADAVGYAHSEGVIHRDVKPSNIIVGAFGETIVVDWGLARDCRRDVPEPELGDYVSPSGSGPVSTVSGKVVGTPAYMSPEQARGELVDERADVYAIGAVLYELLAGTPPHVDTTPQATLDRVLAGPPLPLTSAVPHVPGELGTIVAKAMARDPQARYANATALAEDLRRYQTGKLVSAHSYSAWSLLRKKVSQHRGVVAVALASTIALGVVGVESFRRVVHERNIAQHERGRTEDALSQAEKRKRELVLLQAMTALRKDPTATVAWLKTYEIGDEDRAQIVNVVDEAVSLGVARHVFRPGEWAVDAVFTPDGSRVVVAVRDGVIRAYDLRTGLSTSLGTAPSAPEVIELAPDGSAAITAGTLGEVMLWPLDGGAPRTLMPSTGRMAMSLRFSPDGTQALVDRDKGVLEVVALAGGEATYIGVKGALRAVVADRDWSKQAILSSPNAISALDGKVQRSLGSTTKAITYLGMSPTGDLVIVHDGASVWSIPYAGGAMKQLTSYPHKLIGLAWSPDAKTLALVGHAHDVVLIDVATSKVRELRGHTDALYTVAWTRDGKRLLSASDDATARVWTIADGTSTVLRGHDDDVYRARFSADERQVATASLDGSVRVWQIDRSDARVLTEMGAIENLVLEGDVAVVRTSTSVARWNIASGQRAGLFSWGQDQKSLGTGVPSRDGELLLVPGADWSMELRHRDRPPLQLVGHKGAITRLEFSRDNKFLYSASSDGTLRRWDTTTGASSFIVEGTIAVRGFALAADGRIAVQVGDEARMIAADGTSTTLGKGGKWCVAYAEFDRVGDRLIINRCDRSVALVVGSEVLDLADAYATNRIGASKDGTMIAGAMGDRTVRVWDARTGKQLHVLRGHTDLVMDVAFSPDGSQVASSSYDKTIRIWQLGTHRARVLRGHSSAVDRVVWRDDSHLVTGGRDATLRIWDVPSMSLPTPAELAARLSAATSARIDLDRPTTVDGAGGSS